MRRFVPGLVFSTLALPAAAQDADRVAAFVAAIEGHGCTVSLAQADTFFPSNGFTEMSETRTIVGQLVNEGRLLRSQDAITLLTEACPAPESSVVPALSAPTEERIEAFVALLQQTDCDMTSGEAPVVFPANGFEDPNETRAISRHLHGEGLLELDGAAGMIRLVGAACPTG